MKLLLTSGGITNRSIESAFLELVGKKADDIVIGFVPTAAYVEEDTSWLDEDLRNIKQIGISNILIIDIAKRSKKEWLPLFEQSDVIWINGGNTYYLLDWIRKSGLQQELPRLLETRLYVGSSAGSIIVGPDLSINQFFPEEAAYRLENITGLNYVPFTILPHFNSPLFQQPTESEVGNLAKEVGFPVYAIDDATAVSVNSGEIAIVTEGEYKIFDHNN